MQKNKDRNCGRIRQDPDSTMHHPSDSYQPALFVY